MIGRGADDRQAERHVDRLLEVQRLDRDQRLVVIHAQRRIIVGARAGVEHGVGGVGAGHPPALGRERGDRRLDDLDFLAAELAAFAGMRVEAGDREPRLGDAEVALQPAQCRAAARFDQRRWSAARTLRASGTCVVTGTVRSVGPASIITTFPGATPQRSATNSVWPGCWKPIA